MGKREFQKDPSDSSQIKKYAEDLSKVYKSEKEKRKELEAANRQLLKYADALRESERRYKTLFNSASDAIFIHDLSGGFLEVNQVACEQLGYSQLELLQMNQVNITPQQYSSLLAKRIEKLRLQGHIVFETAHMRRDGSVIPIEASSRLIEYDRKPAALIIARDISERKKAEEARSALQAQLQQAQKMEAIGRLAGGLAHDVNNLMTAVISYASFLMAGLDKDDPMHRDAEEIKKAGKSASSLVQQLLAFSRRQVFQPRLLDLNEVVAVMEKMLRRLIGEDLELVTSLEPDLGKIKADPAQLEQVIVNLAVNARDAMPQGGRLTIQTFNVSLDEDSASELGIEQSGHYVVLAVSDTGVGMDKDTQSHLFEPFFTTKTTGKGTGLGLSSVYGVVKQSSGHIQFYSEPGQGTTFKIYLPCVKGDKQPSQKQHASMEPPYGSETVLLVEGHDMVRDPLKRILQGYGYGVLEAQNGDEALKVSAEHDAPIHLMVTEVLTPGMSGLELAERLHPLRSDMKVLYMSGAVDYSTGRNGALDRGVPFLQKPFTPEELAHKVREVLDAPPVRENLSPK